MNASKKRKASWMVSGYLVILISIIWIGNAFAAPTIPLSGGRTNVKLSTAFVETLAALDITPDDIAPGQLHRRGLARFPIPGGALDFGDSLPAG